MIEWAAKCLDLRAQVNRIWSLKEKAMSRSLVGCRTTCDWVPILVVLLTLPASGLRAEPTVTAFYNPTDGNITLAVLQNGAPATLAISAFQFLSPSQYLSGSAAGIPTSAISAFTVLNTDESAIFDPPRQYAEIYANGLGGTLFSSSWNLGNVAQTGLSQTDLNNGFTSNGDVLSPPQPGKFLYESNATWAAGSLVAVPEPAGVVLLISAGASMAAINSRRRFARRIAWLRRSGAS